MVEQITAAELEQKCADYLHLRTDQPQRAAALLERELRLTRWEMRPEGHAQPLLHPHGVVAHRLLLPGGQTHGFQNLLHLTLRAVQPQQRGAEPQILPSAQVGVEPWLFNQHSRRSRCATTPWG